MSTQTLVRCYNPDCAYELAPEDSEAVTPGVVYLCPKCKKQTLSDHPVGEQIPVEESSTPEPSETDVTDVAAGGEPGETRECKHCHQAVPVPSGARLVDVAGAMRDHRFKDCQEAPPKKPTKKRARPLATALEDLKDSRAPVPEGRLDIEVPEVPTKALAQLVRDHSRGSKAEAEAVLFHVLQVNSTLAYLRGFLTGLGYEVD